VILNQKIGVIGRLELPFLGLLRKKIKRGSWEELGERLVNSSR